MSESILSRGVAKGQSVAYLAHSRDDAETPSVASLVHFGILRLLLSLPSPRHFITSFDPPLFVLDGLLFSYYCLIGLSLHLSVQIFKKIMKPMLNTLAISLKNKGIISVSSKFQSGKNREQKPLVDLACQSDLLVEDFLRESRARLAACSAEEKRRARFRESLIENAGTLPLHNSDNTNAREASKGPCMTEGVRSLVDSTTRISSTDFDAPDNSAHLVRANQSGPIMLNSEKNDTSEGLIGEWLTESVLSLDDSTKRKSFPDFDAAENKAHLVRPYQSGPVVSLSENKNEGEALKKDLQQHCGGRSDAAAKSFRGKLLLLP
ncbi:hypothetical protein RHGRI_038719 [Rhododendron griersonianum]|uniref:Uncharacterized protein n=1 Tax=Rhododendron griersonianum TaxID=479676 RepID=A0AAV6HP29_9ERIC|nr:hypothetical protein RHGRI_038719 [Rhododendron griersonianum]